MSEREYHRILSRLYMFVGAKQRRISWNANITVNGLATAATPPPVSISKRTDVIHLWELSGCSRYTQNVHSWPHCHHCGAFRCRLFFLPPSFSQRFGWSVKCGKLNSKRQLCHYWYCWWWSVQVLFRKIASRRLLVMESFIISLCVLGCDAIRCVCVCSLSVASI